MTEHGRGTAGYRAPELVSDACYTTKVDIWGVGCIGYELLTRTKAFSDDYEVYSYSMDDLELGFPDRLTLGTSEQFLWQILRSMLLVKPTKRPNVRPLHRKLRTQLQRRLSDGRRSPSSVADSESSEASVQNLDEKGKSSLDSINERS